MKLGVAYYPEYNDTARWPEHLHKIKDAGICRVRMAEFAWSHLQPQKGAFNWGWLDDSVKLAADLGLEIILGTPTACPPIWLVREHPEVLPVNREGRRSGFGARQHRCFNSSAYLEHSTQIVEAMAARYGTHPNVVAWQIDNELGGEQKRCHCDNCQRAFQAYLAEKYASIDDLNARWGNHFWSQDYQTWSDIPAPRRFASDMNMKHHPSLELEFTRFSSRSITRFCKLQADILRRHTRRPITTNTDTFLFGDNVDVHELFQPLDVGGMDIYSESPHEIAFYSDLARSLKGDRFWMMEFATGSPRLREHMDLIRDAGCEWFLLFTFLPFAAGQEQGFKGLLTMTEEPEPNYAVVRRWADDHAHAEARAFTPPEIGLYYHFDSSWACWIDTWSNTITDKLAYPKYMVNTLYRSLFEAGIRTQFAFSPDAISVFKKLILPWQLIHETELENRLIEFVENGGRLVVTPDLFRKNADNVYLRVVPRIYRRLLDWHANAFIEETPADGPVLRHVRAGRGEVWMVRRQLDVEQWRAFLRDTF